MFFWHFSFEAIRPFGWFALLEKWHSVFSNFYSYVAVFVTEIDDVQLMEYVHDAGLTDLYQRVGGFDSPVCWNWYMTI